MATERQMLSVWVRPGLIKLLKIVAATEEKYMKEVVQDALEVYIQGKVETLQTLGQLKTLLEEHDDNP